MVKTMSKYLLLSIVIIGCANDPVVVKKGVVVGSNDIERVERYLSGADFNLREVGADPATQRLVAQIDPATKRLIAQVAKSSVLIVTVVPTVGRKNELKFCSGSLINIGGEPRILTNQHCFAKIAAGNKDQNLDELLPQACLETRVYFDFNLPVANTSVNRCRRGTLRTNHRADLASFALEKPLPDGVRPLEFWQGELEDLVGRKVFTIHHPGTGPKNTLPLPDLKAPAPSKMITVRNCLYLGGFAQETWDDRGGIPYQIRHTCDLLDGSSGSGLVDLQTGKLLGVNIGSVEMQVITSSKSKPEVVNQMKYTYNVATVAKFVRDFTEDRPLPDPQTLSEIPDPTQNE